MWVQLINVDKWLLKDASEGGIANKVRIRSCIRPSLSPKSPYCKSTVIFT